jgi:3-oxoadipate enol-lactonase
VFKVITFETESRKAMLTLNNGYKIEANGITIAYDDSGITGTQTVPMIFIHGFPFNRESWKHQYNFFRNTHRVITYDIRGFGDSGNNHEKPSIQLFADDLIALMDDLKIEKAIICGLSMGGYIVLEAIEKYPERFEAIILCDTQCIADSIEAADKRHFAIQQIEAGGIAEFASAYVKKIFSNDTQLHNKELVEKTRHQIISTSPSILTWTQKALLKRRDTSFTLENIKVPALIICGADDTVTPVAQSQYLAKNISNSSFNTIEKAGHLSNLEKPEEFNKLVNKFISGLPSHE